MDQGENLLLDGNKPEGFYMDITTSIVDYIIIKWGLSK